MRLRQEGKDTNAVQPQTHLSLLISVSQKNWEYLSGRIAGRLKGSD